MSTLRITNIEAKADPSSPTVDEKIKLTNSNGDILVHIDGKTSGITTIGINTTAGNIKFDQNSNVVVTGIITATKFVGTIEPTSLEIGSNIKLGNAGVITATSYVGDGSALTGIDATQIQTGNTSVQTVDTGSDGHVKITTEGTERLRITSAGNLGIGGLTNPGALLSIPAGESNTPRLAIESAVDDNDFTITQYEDGNGTYTMLGQNVKLNSGGNNTVLDSAHRTAGILLDARNHGAITFLTGGANAVGENVKIDSGGRLLIGTTSADSNTRLHVSAAENTSDPMATDASIVIANTQNVGNNEAASLKFNVGNTNTASISAHYDSFNAGVNSSLRFYTQYQSAFNSPAERMRITSSGDMGLGTTNPVAKLDVRGNVYVGSSIGVDISNPQDYHANANDLVVNNGMTIANTSQGSIYFADSSSGTGEYVGQINYNHANNRFDYVAGNTSVARLESNGSWSTFSSSVNIDIANTQAAGNNEAYIYARYGSTALGAGSLSFRVYTNGNVQNTNNSYGSVSDQNLKENIVDATSQWDDIKALQVRKYNFREATGHQTHTQLGLIAQEVETVSPGLVETTTVREGETCEDADGNQLESIKSIHYSVVYMKALKALQEAQTRIETLETQLTDALARITALEG